jgi:hypothetical protein
MPLLAEGMDGRSGAKTERGKDMYQLVMTWPSGEHVCYTFDRCEQAMSQLYSEVSLPAWGAILRDGWAQLMGWSPRWAQS